MFLSTTYHSSLERTTETTESNEELRAVFKYFISPSQNICEVALIMSLL